MARRQTRSYIEGYDYDWRPYVSSEERRRQAAQAVQRLRKTGRELSPIAVTGRRIATTFWGSAWCDNLERYSDFANRLPRGRTYVRGRRVIDLKIGTGTVTALVSGSEVYQVTITVAPVPAARWRQICLACAGGIDSLVELLQGRFSQAVMAHLCTAGTGLFPTPREITFACSCPDWASMCKHVAAALYGVGARLDRQPELLFQLRQVDAQGLFAGASAVAPLSAKTPKKGRVLATRDLADVFGVEMAPAPPAKTRAPRRTPRRAPDTPVVAAPTGVVAKPRKAATPATASGTPAPMKKKVKSAAARPSKV